MSRARSKLAALVWLVLLIGCRSAFKSSGNTGSDAASSAGGAAGASANPTSSSAGGEAGARASSSGDSGGNAGNGGTSTSGGTGSGGEGGNPMTPGVFNVSARRSYTVDLSDVRQDVLVLDQNGDKLDDLVISGTRDGYGIAVLYATPEGVFVEGPTFTLDVANAPGSWSEYQLRAGDVDDDGDDDLVWNYNRNDEGNRVNILYVALSNRDAGFELAEPVQQFTHPSVPDASYRFFLADINGDRKADALWSSVGVIDENLTHIGVATEAGQFQVQDGVFQRNDLDGGQGSAGGWLPYLPLIADFDGDGRADIAWNALGASRNDVHSSFARADLSPDAQQIDFSSALEPGTPFQWGGDWSLFLTPISPHKERVLVGNIDGAFGNDLAWGRVDADSGVAEIWSALNNRRAFVRAEASYELALQAGGNNDHFVMLLADVAGDDKDDLIVNEKGGTVNRIYTSLSEGTGSFDLTPVVQQLPQTDETRLWSQYQLLSGNFGGSTKHDLAWVLPTNETSVYVGIAK